MKTFTLKGSSNDYSFSAEKVEAGRSMFGTIFKGKRLTDNKAVLINKLNPLFRDNKVEILRCIREASFQF